MSTAFSRSLRSLENDGARGWALGVGVGVAIVGSWTAWALLARVSVYAESVTARLEDEHAVVRVEPTMSGRVIESHLELGAEVHAGDVLLVLDSGPGRLRLAEAASALAGIGPQLAARRRELEAEERGTEFDRERGSRAVAEARLRSAQADAAARHAEDLLARSRQLYSGGNTSQAENAEREAEAERLRLISTSERIAVARITAEERGARSDRQARIEDVSREVAALEAEERSAKATVERLEDEVGRATFRAPVDGRIGQSTPVAAGGWVHEGERIAAIVPSGGPRLVAEFTPASALGRVRAGQRARLRLDGFPWTQYGSIDATVGQVSSELRDGLVRVELSVISNGRIPLEHGLPGTVTVELERVAPALLILRAAALATPFDPGAVDGEARRDSEARR